MERFPVRRPQEWAARLDMKVQPSGETIKKRNKKQGVTLFYLYSCYYYYYYYCAGFAAQVSDARGAES